MFDGYIDESITIVHAYNAGGEKDTESRFLEDTAEGILDYSFVVVKNYESADRETGVNHLANSNPDKHIM